VTFQVALVGQNGIVVASDRRVTYVTPDGVGAGHAQLTSAPKYLISADESIVCFAAGSPRATNSARALLDEVPAFESETHWQTNLASRVNTVQGQSNDFDEVMVVRRDTMDRVWLITKMRNLSASVTPIQTRICTGTPVSSRFIASHFYKPGLSLAELQGIAALTLACASREHPSSISRELDMMTLEEGTLSWKQLSDTRVDAVWQIFQNESEEISSQLSSHFSSHAQSN